MDKKPTYAELKRRLETLESSVPEVQRIEAELRESRERFRLLSESSPLGVFQTDAEGRVLYLNGKWLEITGLRMEDALDEGWAQALHPEDHDWVLAEWQRCIDEETAWEGEFRLIGPDGETIWTHTRTAPVFSPEGKATSHVGINEDITQRKRTEAELASVYRDLDRRIAERTADLNQMNRELEQEIDARRTTERALRESEERYRLLFENSPVGIGVSDGEGRIIDFNDAVFKPGGYTRVDIERLDNMAELYFDPATRQEVISKAQRDGRVDEMEVQFKRKDGSPHAALLSLRPITLDGSRCWQSVIQDVEERRRNEKLLQSSLQEKDMLLREIHHRVKNNLQVTSSLLAISRHDGMGQEALDKLSEARNRINTMALIHSQLYDGDHLDSINIAEHMQRLSTHLLQTYVGPKRSIRITVEPSDTHLPLIQSIPLCLAINELLSNACKHAFDPGDEGSVEVSVDREADDTVCIRIKDNGKGIPATIADNAGRTTGLNLATRLIEDQLKGSLRLTIAGGTEAVIRLRLEALSVTSAMEHTTPVNNRQE